MVCSLPNSEKNVHPDDEHVAVAINPRKCYPECCLIIKLACCMVLLVPGPCNESLSATQSNWNAAFHLNERHITKMPLPVLILI